MPPQASEAGSHDHRLEHRHSRTQLVAHHSTGPDTDLSGRDRGAHHVDAESHHGGRIGSSCDDPGLSGHHSSRRTAGAPAHRLRFRCGRSTDTLDHRRHVYSGSGRCSRCTGHDAHSQPILAGNVCLGIGILCHWRGNRCHWYVPARVARQACGTGAKAGCGGTRVVHDDHRLRGHRRCSGALSGSLLPRAPNDGNRYRVDHCDHGDVGRHPRYRASHAT